MNNRETLNALRQMIAALDEERQALAGLDLEAIVGAADRKERLCGALESLDGNALEEECHALLQAARQKNEVNRQIRNLVAANVSARLDTLSGAAPIYNAGAAAVSARLRV